MKHSAEVQAVIAELEKHNAEVLKVTMGGIHPRVYYSYQGKTRFIVTAGSGSDRRGPANARQSVRNALGIVREKKIGERRKAKNIIVKSAPLPERITLGKDPFVELRARRLAQITPDDAWAAWFGRILQDNGHEPVNEQIRAAMGLPLDVTPRLC